MKEGRYLQFGGGALVHFCMLYKKLKVVTEN